MAQEALITIATRHQSHYERLKSAEVKKFDDFLKQMDRDLRLKLSGLEIESLTRSKIETQIKQVGVLLDGTYSNYKKVWIESVTEAGIYEAGFEGRSLEQVVEGVNFKLPSDSQITAAVFNTPLGDIGGPSGGSLLDTFFDDMSKAEVKRIEGAIRLGYAEGQTTPQIIRRIRGTKAAGFNDGLLAISKRNAETITRTALQHAAQQAREEVWKKNSKVANRTKIVATLDLKTSDRCRSLDGQIFPVGEGPRPPFHPRCLTGDTNISTCGPVLNVFKRTYEGDIIDVTTKSGRTMSITPNHPVLTRGGWKAAGDLNCLDELACINDSSPDNYKDSVEAKFSDLFAAINISSDSSLIASGPSSAEDFHGDGADSDISIINVNSLAWDRVRKMLRKSVKNNRLKFGVRIKLTFHSFCSSNFAGPFNNGPSRSIMGGLSKFRNFLWRSAVHSGFLLFGPTSNRYTAPCKGPNNNGGANREMFSDSTGADTREIHIDNIRIDDFLGGPVRNSFDVNASSFEVSPDSITSDAELASNIFDRRSSVIEFDSVVDKVVRSFSGHVYNLENNDNWYLSNDIITHNCRTGTVAVLNKKYEDLSRGRTRSQRDPETGKIGRTSAKTTYYDWLKRQPAKMQDSVIGPTRGKLLRNGGLSSGRFAELQLGKNFEPLNLEEMRKLDSVAFEKAGL